MEPKSLDEIIRKTAQVSEFARNASDYLSNVEFEPDETESIEAALRDVHLYIEKSLALYPDNSWVNDIAEQIRREMHTSLLERAIETRIGG